jgi:DNA-binding NarL/FixJ family response regulator
MSEIIESKRSSLKEKRIWFLEHEPDVQIEIRSNLIKFGFDANLTNVTGNIDEATNAALSDEVDVFVSDYKLPGRRTGIEVLEEIRKKNKTIVLALYTGFTVAPETENAIRCKNANIFFHHKLDSFEPLIQNLSSYINRIPEYQTIKEESLWSFFISKFTPHKNSSSERILVFQKRPRLTLEQEREKLENEIIESPKELYINLIGKKKLIENISLIENSPPKSKTPIEFNLSNIENAELTETLKNVILDMASDLLQDLEKIPDQKLIVHSSEGEITIEQLRNEIKCFTKVGLRYVADWFKAEKMIRDIEAQK